MRHAAAEFKCSVRRECQSVSAPTANGLWSTAPVVERSKVEEGLFVWMMCRRMRELFFVGKLILLSFFYSHQRKIEAKRLGKKGDSC